MVFGYEVVPIPILFIRIFFNSTTVFENLNNLKGEPYYKVKPLCSGHHGDLKIVFVIERCPLHRGSS